MSHIRRLRSKTLRIIFACAVDLLMVAETLARKLPANYHMVGEDTRTWLEKMEDYFGIQPPSTTRDLRVNIVIAVATLQVVLIILATAAVYPAILLLIPTFCFYTAAMLAYRQYRLKSSNLAS